MKKKIQVIVVLIVGKDVLDVEEKIRKMEFIGESVELCLTLPEVV